MSGNVGLFDPSTGGRSNEALRGLNSFTVIPIVIGAESDPLNLRENSQDCTIDIDTEIQAGAPNCTMAGFCCAEFKLNYFLMNLT